MQGSQAQIIKDAEEIYRYRLSMDEQFTIPPERIIQFMAKYQDFYERRRELKEWQLGSK